MSAINIQAMRIRAVNDVEASSGGQYVLYWMTASRRVTYNFGLQRAVEWAKKLNKPLLVFEELSCDFPWASDRMHQFVLQGMAHNAKQLTKKSALYFPYVERNPEDSLRLLSQLAGKACLVVSDDFPTNYFSRRTLAAKRSMKVRLELVDSNGLLPMRAANKVFKRAFDFRRFLQKSLLPHLADVPVRDPLSKVKLPSLNELPRAITKHWPMANPAELMVGPDAVNSLPIDHAVGPVETVGGSQEASKTLRAFLKNRLSVYDSDRNQPSQDATSDLSPYLHTGHISAHEVFIQLTQWVGWTPGSVSTTSTGSAGQWWGASPDVESFLDQLITWRELGYNMCFQREDHDQYESLPDWAQQTLAKHAQDVRPYVYSLEQFEAAQTHDRLWNASQRQLLQEGRIHNYLRMLWGKKILEWSPSPQYALDAMIELNNKYALDGCNPNSYSGIFWVLGRYDRAWGPERPVFGKIRYMSSENTARKFRMKQYIERYSANNLF